jgi:hypothetical protein
MAAALKRQDIWAWAAARDIKLVRPEEGQWGFGSEPGRQLPLPLRCRQASLKESFDNDFGGIHDPDPFPAFHFDGVPGPISLAPP